MVQVSNLLSIGFSLFFATALLELHASHVHDGSGDLVDVIFFLLCETEYVESFLYQKK